MRTDLPVEAQIAELVREKALALTRDELPHAIYVEVEEIGESVVRAALYVETESQKQIVVGKGGRIVREIGTRARPEIEAAARPPRSTSSSASRSGRTGAATRRRSTGSAALAALSRRFLAMS